MHTHTRARARTLARTHAHIYQILQILYLISFQFAQVRQPKRMEKVTSAIVTVVLKDHKIARGTRQPSTWFATHTGIRVYVKKGGQLGLGFGIIKCFKSFLDLVFSSSPTYIIIIYTYIYALSFFSFRKAKWIRLSQSPWCDQQIYREWMP